MNPPDPIVTVGDLRAAHCVRGIKAWFVERGYDWRVVFKNGVPASELAATGDALVMPTVERVRERARG